MTYDVIIFTDIADRYYPQRGLGAYKIAHTARQHGYTALVVDFSSVITLTDFKKIIKKIVGDNTKCVGFSNTWYPYRMFGGAHYITGPSRQLESEVGLSTDFAQNNVKPYIDFIKKINPNTDCVIGGAKTFEYIHEDAWDKVFVGYSENHFIDYLNGKDNKIFSYDMKGKNGDFNFSAHTVDYQDTDCLKPEDVLTLEVSRGCIFKCVFCSYPHRGQNTKEYTKYQDVLYNELKSNYDRWGVYKYYITDDTFNDYTPKLELLNEVVQDLDFDPMFEAYVRMDIVAKQKHQAKLLYDIGVRQVYYGLETWNDQTSKIIKKGDNLERKIQGIKNCHEVWQGDVHVNVGYVVGLPEDTEKDTSDLIDWYKNEGRQYIHNLSFNALIIKDTPGLQQYLFNSDIDNNPARYNYKVKGLSWTRNDSGDINSYEQAEQITESCNQRVKFLNTWPPKVWKPTDLWDKYCQGKEDPLTHFFQTYYYPNLLEHING